MLSVLFSNNELLQRYDKPIPKTWDQLIEITQYILNKEKEKGNTDISGYAPLFPSKYINIYIFIILYKQLVNYNES